MKIFLFRNQEKVQTFEPDSFAKVKIGEVWHDLGTAKKLITTKGTPYYEIEVDDDILVDKLRDIDWKPKGEKTGQFVKEVEDERQESRYPDYLHADKRDVAVIQETL